jgi:hypothetical protein
MRAFIHHGWDVISQRDYHFTLAPHAQNLEIPTRSTNVRYIASITSCASAKIFGLGPGRINSLNLQLPGVVLSKCAEK